MIVTLALFIVLILVLNYFHLVFSVVWALESSTFKINILDTEGAILPILSIHRVNLVDSKICINFHNEFHLSTKNMPKLLIFLFPPGVHCALGFWFSSSSIKQVLFVSWSKCLWYIIHFVGFFQIIQKTSSICFCNIKNILGFLLQSSLCCIFPHHSKTSFI